MTERVHIAGPQASRKLLARIIEENQVGAVPIVDIRGMPIGIVSESDLRLKGRVAADLISAPPMTVSATSAPIEAARVMDEHNLRHLIVVDARGRIAGMVSRSDVEPPRDPRQ